MHLFWFFEGVARRCLSRPVAYDPSSVILLLTLLSSAYSLSNFCAFHLLPLSLMSDSFILSLFRSHTHTHQCLRHASPAPVLPLQLHFICCRSSRVAPLNDSVQPVVGVLVLLIMPVSLWGEKYRQIRPEDLRALAPVSSHLMGASRTQSKYKIAAGSNSDGGLGVRYLGPLLVKLWLIVQKQNCPFHSEPPWFQRPLTLTDIFKISARSQISKILQIRHCSSNGSWLPWAFYH